MDALAWRGEDNIYIYLYNNVRSEGFRVEFVNGNNLSAVRFIELKLAEISGKSFAALSV